MTLQKTKHMARVGGLTLILLANAAVAANDAPGRDAVKIGGSVTIEEGRETAVSVVGFGAELVSRVGRVQPVTVG